MRTLSLFLIAAALAINAPPIHVPSVPTPPTPPPVPGTPLRFSAGQIFIVSCDNPLVIAASPEGVVSITPDVGPQTISGIFVDGNGKTERRKITDKNIYFVDALATGKCELLIIEPPDTKILRLSLDVSAGPGPIPPGPVDPLTKAVADAIAADGSPMTLQNRPLANAFASLYLVASTATSQDPAVITVQDLFGKVKQAEDALIDPAKIPHVRAVVGPVIATAIGNSGPLNRDAAKAVFGKLSTAFQGAQK